MSRMIVIVGFLLALSASLAAADIGIVVDIDGDYTNGPDTLLMEPTDTVEVNIWITGEDSLVGFGITLGDTAGALIWIEEPGNLVYTTPSGWTNINIVQDSLGWILIQASDFSASTPLVLPSKVAEMDFVVAPGESCGVIVFDTELSGWQNWLFIEGSFASCEMPTICVTEVLAGGGDGGSEGSPGGEDGGGGPSAPETGGDSDGNGIDDQDEADLARKFCPILILNSGDTPGMKPCPVSIMGGSPNSAHDLRADNLWVWVKSDALPTFAGEYSCSDPRWNPPPQCANADYNYSSYSDQYGITYTGAPPEHAYYQYTLYLHPEYGGPEKNCPLDWEGVYLDGWDPHPPGSSFSPTTYVHFFVDAISPVIQYWFFYPYNDWVNNHEGDWEHINLRITSTDPEAAEITGATYFFHELVATVYLEELVLVEDTHPVIFVGGYGEKSYSPCGSGSFCGGDGNFGPGSHASYPVPGLWHNVGSGQVPGGDPADDNAYRCGQYIHYEDLAIKILPEPETINFSENPRQSWITADFKWGSWDVPTYCDNWCEAFGYANCGDMAPKGPLHNDGWNQMYGGGWDLWTGEMPQKPATVLFVPTQYPTIQDAADCLIGCDTIMVSSGTYSGMAVFNQTVVLLTSGGASSTTWNCDPDESCADLKRGGVIGALGSGFTFISNSYIAEYAVRIGSDALDENEGMIRDCVFSGNRVAATGTGLKIPIYADCNVLMQNNLFEDHAYAVDIRGFQGGMVSIGGALDRANDFIGNSYNIRLPRNGAPDVDAEFNYWGTVQQAEIEARISGNASHVDYEPWTDETHSELYYISYVGVQSSNEPVALFSFEPGIPNPLYGGEDVYFRISSRAAVFGAVYDVRGRLVKKIINDTFPPGRYVRNMGMDGLASGVYFIQITAGDHHETHKIVLLR